jgi:2-polyprenyl-6-methoxyphenol hydroxylase-like FAD-dependent oxidoreductase
LCIGDAAHAMSPVGGVGINLAIQDAVASANILVPHFGQTPMGEAPLAAVQRRREWPARMTQRIQVFVQNRVMNRILDSTQPMTPPLPVRLLDAVPILRTIPAYVVGVGFRPEHVRSPER